MGRRSEKRGGRRGWPAWALVAALVSGTAGSDARGQPDLDAGDAWRATLSPEERAWLEQEPRLRIAFDGHFPPYSFLNADGELEGFSVDVVALLAQRTGIRFEYSPLTMWNELYAAGQAGDVDVIATMVSRPERAQWFSFTKPYVFKSLVIVKRKGDRRIRGKQNLADKAIAVVRGYQYVEPLREAYPSAQLKLYDTMLEAMNAVTVGDADAAITYHAAANYVRIKYQLTNLVLGAVYDQDSSLESIAVHKQLPLARSVLDKALASISEDQRLALERKWLPAARPLATPARMTLTARERAWIEDHPVIRLGVDPEFHPFEFIDDEGIYSGFAADYVALLNDRLGLNMVIVPDLSWQQATEGVKRGDIDVLPCVGMTRERARYLDYTAPYLEFQRVIITRTDSQFIRGLEDLGDRVVAVQSNSSHEGYLAENSALVPRAYSTLQDAIRAVSDGEADALVGNVASATYWIRRLNLTNLKVAAAVGDEIQSLHFAVRKDWPTLAGLLEKGLASVTEQERREISQRWLVVRHDPHHDYGPVIRIALVAAGVVALLLIWIALVRRSRRRLRVAKNAAEDAERETAAANAELRAMRDELEDLVKARTAELIERERMFQEAQRMDALGNLVGGIAHDFNNVLTGLLGTIFLAKSRIGDSEEASEHLEAASKLGFRGAAMVRQLLAYARTDAAAEKTEVDVETLFEDVLSIVRASLPGSIELDVDIDAGGAKVKCNASILEQVVLNLVNNARDAVDGVERPRITLRVARRTLSAELAGRQPALAERELICIEVTDNGVGMDEYIVGRIFEPFYTTKEKGKGTGLGLSMVGAAVSDHGGVIDVASTVGEGTAFRVYLPSWTHDDEAADAADERIHRGAGELILLADDDDDALQAHRGILGELGYRVLAARDGEEALGLLEEAGSAVRLAILDVVMPRMDGLTLARRIRERYPRVRVIFLSAQDYSRGLPEHLQRSNELLLLKPCPVPRLSRAVMERLRESPGQRAVND